MYVRKRFSVIVTSCGGQEALKPSPLLPKMEEGSDHLMLVAVALEHGNRLTRVCSYLLELVKLGRLPAGDEYCNTETDRAYHQTENVDQADQHNASWRSDAREFRRCKMSKWHKCIPQARILRFD
jgi:hypothetical protein